MGKRNQGARVGFSLDCGKWQEEFLGSWQNNCESPRNFGGGDELSGYWRLRRFRFEQPFASKVDPQTVKQLKGSHWMKKVAECQTLLCTEADKQPDPMGYWSCEAERHVCCIPGAWAAAGVSTGYVHIGSLSPGSMLLIPVGFLGSGPNRSGTELRRPVSGSMAPEGEQDLATDFAAALPHPLPNPPLDTFATPFAGSGAACCMHNRIKPCDARIQDFATDI